MKFCLRALGQNKGVEIAQQEFVALKNAKQIIVQYLRIEDTFDVMMENYVELERTLFHVAMDHLAFSFVVSDELHLKRSLISRRLMNLFASTQLYRNTLKRQSGKILKRGNGAETIKAAVDDSSDQPMEFRLMQVIRNYSQHDELPLSSLSVGGRKTGADRESEQFRFALFRNAENQRACNCSATTELAG